MIDPTTKKQFKRRFRRRQRQLEDFGQQTEASLDQHFFRRLGRLYDVRRFVIGWIVLVIILVAGTVFQTRALSSYYQIIKPVTGGIYNEGVVGSFTNANPIFANNDVDLAVSRMIFPGLLRYDERNRLTGDLASEWSVDTTGKVYTVLLRKNLVWQDGTPLTADDVAFTISTIQNPDVRSPFLASWQGVTVKAVDPTTITFTLNSIFAPFPHSLTQGIVPKHILKDTPVSGLRSSLFNTARPVGSGPFKWSLVEVSGETVTDHQQRIALIPNPLYHGGKVRLSEFILHTFLDENQMLESFKRGDLSAISGIEAVDADLATDNNITITNIPLSGAVMVFLRTSQDMLKDVNVRKALVMATDRSEILSGLTVSTDKEEAATSMARASLPVNGPLLPSHVGYNPAIRELDFNVAEANKLLDTAGWVRGADGMRAKGETKLELTLNTLSKSEYAMVAGRLQRQWKEVGVKVDVGSLDDRDMQERISNRTYDALLYAISMGADADQFAYWHSTQFNPLSPQRLNFSDYSSKAVDTALEAGRTRIDPTLRSVKYQPFLENWRNDAPAIALYQPRLLYVTRGTVRAPISKHLITPADRFNQVNTWTVRVRRGIE